MLLEIKNRFILNKYKYNNMKQINYNPFGNKGVILKFRCTNTNCNKIIETEEIPIPSSDLTSDTAMDSYNYNEDTVNCGCNNAEYNISVGATYYDGFIEISELDATWNVDVKEIPDENTDEILED